jgi:Rieske Fe-S protein
VSRSLVRENANVVRRFVADRLKLPGREAIEGLAPGEGAVVRVEGETLAVSRSEDGSLTAVSPRCTHLACYVAWNGAERTWDCPCHGSRYLPDGSVIEGPAVRDLAPRQVPGSADSSTRTRT